MNSGTTSDLQQQVIVLENECKDVMGNDDADESENIAIELPVLKYGYRTIPYTYEELYDIIMIQQKYDMLTRSKVQQIQYEKWKVEILHHEQWNSISDYVLYTKFSNLFSKKLSIINKDNNEMKWIIDPPVDTISTTHTKLVKNDFPYCIDLNQMEHWIYWKLGPATNIITNDEIDVLKQELHTNYHLQNDRIVHWMNPIHLKSIPNIDHVHFIGMKTMMMI